MFATGHVSSEKTFVKKVKNINQENVSFLKQSLLIPLYSFLPAIRKTKNSKDHNILYSFMYNDIGQQNSPH